MTKHKGPPTAEVTPAIMVMLQYEFEEGDNVGSRFLDWCRKERVYGLRVGSTGPGWVHNAYRAEDAERIKKWFAENGIEVSPTTESQSAGR